MDCFRWEFYCWKCPRYLTKEEKGGSFHCKRFVCCFAFFTLLIAMDLRILNMGLMRINENYCKWYLFICASSRVQVFSMQGRGISFGRNSNAILWTIIGSLHYHRQHNGHCIRWRWGLRIHFHPKHSSSASHLFTFLSSLITLFYVTLFARFFFLDLLLTSLILCFCLIVYTTIRL